MQTNLPENVDRAVTYGGGIILFLYSSLAELAAVAQQVGMIVGCIVVSFKLYTDIRKHLRDRKREKQNEDKDS